MRKILFMMALVSGVAVLVLGCGSGDTASTDQAATEKTEAAATDKAEATHDAGTRGTSYEKPSESPAATPAMLATASLEVSGKLGCGHCSFHVKEECSLALKTEDGEIYMIEAGDRQEELMDHRLDEPMAKISGQMVESDGQKVIHTELVELF